MTLGQFLYGYLIAVGLIVLVLVVLAVNRAATAQTAGRLMATLCLLAGLIVASTGRLTEPVALPPLVACGLAMVNIGLTLYVLYLPDHGLLQLIRRRKGSGGGQ